MSYNMRTNILRGEAISGVMAGKPSYQLSLALHRRICPLLFFPKGDFHIGRTGVPFGNFEKNPYQKLIFCFVGVSGNVFHP